MNDDDMQDLKQFIATTVSQQTSDLSEEIKNLDNKLTNQIENLSSSVAEAIDNTNEVVDIQINDHEKRITHLEHKAA